MTDKIKTLNPNLQTVEEEKDFKKKRVNITKKMFDSFRKFITNKLGPAVVKAVSYIPGVKNLSAQIVEQAKQLDAKQENTTDTPASTATEDIPVQDDSIVAPAIFDAPTPKETTNSDETVKIENVAPTPAPSKDESIKVIQPKVVKADTKKSNTDNNQKDSQSATPKVHVATPTILHITPNQVKNHKPEKSPVEAKESDEEILNNSRDQYGDLIPFDNYKNYYYSFDAAEIFRKNQTGEMIDEDEFNQARKTQAEARKRILEAEETMRQAEKDANKQKIENNRLRVKENEDRITKLNSEIDSLTEENSQLKKENQKAGSRLTKLKNETTKATATINEMDAIIDSINSAQNLQERLKGTQTPQASDKDKAAELDAKAKKRVDEMYREIEKEFNAKRDKKAKKETMSNLATAVKEVSKQKTSSKSKKDPEPSKTEVTPQVDENASLLNELSSFDSKETSNSQTTANWKNDFIDNTTDNFVDAINKINQSDLSAEEKAEQRQALYDQFDNFVDMNDAEPKHKTR